MARKIVIALTLFFTAGLAFAESTIMACVESRQVAATMVDGEWQDTTLQPQRLVIQYLNEPPYLKFGDRHTIRFENCEKLIVDLEYLRPIESQNNDPAWAINDIVIQCYRPYGFFSLNVSLGIAFQSTVEPNAYMATRHFECETF